MKGNYVRKKRIYSKRKAISDTVNHELFFLSGYFGRCFRLPPRCWRLAHHIYLPFPNSCYLILRFNRTEYRNPSNLSLLNSKGFAKTKNPLKKLFTHYFLFYT